jgi:DNA-directed RNA polymerase beta' subunit
MANSYAEQLIICDIKEVLMKIDFFNIEEFIKANNCPQVSNPVHFNEDGTPTTDGIFSYELFGIMDNDRKNIFGYIDLHGYYIHPLAYSVMKKRMGSLRDVFNGDKYAVIVNKKIKIVDKDFKGAETGLDFFYNNFEKIDWIDAIEEEEIDSLDKKTRLKFLQSLKKNEFFVSKWLVVPPFYRAESSERQTTGDDINKMYKELISKTNSMKKGFGAQTYSIFGTKTKLDIQEILVNIYEETTRPIRGKNSMFRDRLLGKRIDYTSGNVITSPDIASANKPKDMPVQFGYSSYPLVTLISLFHPFFLNKIQEFMMSVMNVMKETVVDLKNIDLNQFNSKEIEKLIALFIRSEAERFQPVLIKYTDKSGKERDSFFFITEHRTENDAKENKNGIIRKITLTDIFFLAADEICQDKHIYVTRYPITGFQSIFPTKIKVMSTVKTREVYIRLNNGNLDSAQGVILKSTSYPFIRYEEDPKPAPKTHYGFIDVYIAGNIYLSAIGGDYDGDVLYMRGVYSKEANAETEKLIYSKTNMLSVNGVASRGITRIGREAMMSLFELTKEGS